MRRSALSAVLALLLLPGIGGSAGAALIGGSYQLDWSQDVARKGTESTDVRKVKHTLEVKYKGFLSPVVENELSFKIEQEVKSDAADTIRLLPTMDLGFRGKYWEAKAGGKRTHENSDDPTKPPKVTDSYYVEMFYLAKKSVPDLKVKYTLDTDFQEGVVDTRKQGITLSSVYKPTDWLDTKADYLRETSDDLKNANSDTENEKTNGTVSIQHMMSEKIKFNVQYNVEISRGATLVDTGGSTSPKEDQLHALKSAVAFRPFRDTDIDGSYDYELKENLVTATHTHTTNQKIAAGQKIGRIIDVKGEFLRVLTDTLYSADDNDKTEDTWKVEAAIKLSKQLDFQLKHEDKHVVEVHVDPTKSLVNSTLTDSAAWTGELAPFWRATASYDRTDTFLWDPVARREFKSTTETKYGLRSTFIFKGIDLTLDPSYDITMRDDFALRTDADTREFKFKVAYKVFRTQNMEAKLEHTFGRKTDSGAKNIQRKDDSLGTLVWKDLIPGWTLGVDLTRAATDTSGDDLPPDINSTFGFKADYRYEWLSFNSSYKYDKKSLSDDAATLDAKIGWTAVRWDTSLTYTFTKTYSTAIDEKSTLTLLFKYNL